MFIHIIINSPNITFQKIIILYNRFSFMGIAGIDKRDYPGDNTIQWLINNTNLKWTGFYLAPSPCQGNISWMNKYNALKNFGWGFAPIYVGQQDPITTGCPSSAHVLTQAQCITDASEAATLVTRLAFLLVLLFILILNTEVYYPEIL